MVGQRGRWDIKKIFFKIKMEERQKSIGRANDNHDSFLHRSIFYRSLKASNKAPFSGGVTYLPVDPSMEGEIKVQ